MPQRIESSVEVGAPVQDVYEYWKTLENLPQFMKNIEEVRPSGPDTTHWVVKGRWGTGPSSTPRPPRTSPTRRSVGTPRTVTCRLRVRYVSKRWRRIALASRFR